MTDPTRNQIRRLLDATLFPEPAWMERAREGGLLFDPELIEKWGHHGESKSDLLMELAAAEGLQVFLIDSPVCEPTPVNPIPSEDASRFGQIHKQNVAPVSFEVDFNINKEEQD